MDNTLKKGGKKRLHCFHYNGSTQGTSLIVTCCNWWKYDTHSSFKAIWKHKKRCKLSRNWVWNINYEFFIFSKKKMIGYGKVSFVGRHSSVLAALMIPMRLPWRTNTDRPLCHLELKALQHVTGSAVGAGKHTEVWRQQKALQTVVWPWQTQSQQTQIWREITLVFFWRLI